MLASRATRGLSAPRAPLGAARRRRAAAAPPRAFQQKGEPAVEARALERPPAPAPPEWAGRRYSLAAPRGAPLPEDLPPSLARPSLSLATDREHPTGALAPAPHFTVLQAHVAFSDPDRDGVIAPRDTFAGLRRLGFNLALSAAAAVLIRGAMPPATANGRGFPLNPARFLRIYVDDIHLAKHGSDSKVYDTEGRWLATKFEEIWSKYDPSGRGELELPQVQATVRGNRNMGDAFGAAAAQLEWWVTFALAARDAGGGRRVLFKDDARGVLDGSLFYAAAARVEAERAAR